MTNKGTFNEYGHDFQVKALTCMFTDKYFLSQIVDQLYPRYFESEGTEYIANIIIEYYEKYKDTPSAEVVAFQIGNLKDDDDKREANAVMRQVGKFIESSDLEFIKESIIQFCKNQEMKKAVIRSVDLLESGNYEEIYELIGTALTVGMDTNLGHDYQEEFEARYELEYHTPIPTPFKAINDITKGGPGAGHLCVVMAGPGVGKSWMLAALGAKALEEGKTVLHYTMELSDIYVGRRYDTILSGVHIDELDNNKKFVHERVKEKNKGKLIVRSYYSNSVSAIGLQGHIDKCIRLDVKPDIIIVDYADLMKLNGKGELRHQLESLYQNLRRISGEYQVPLWTASQLNRDGAGEDFADGDKVAEAFNKNNTPDLILSVSRPAKLRDTDILFGFIIKSRLGPDKKKFIGRMDTNYGSMELHDHKSPEARDILLSAPMSNGEPDQAEKTADFIKYKLNKKQGTSNPQTDDIPF